MAYVKYIPLIDRNKKKYMPKICNNKNHLPPGHIVLRPGTHIWKCPSCGYETKQVVMEEKMTTKFFKK